MRRVIGYGCGGGAIVVDCSARRALKRLPPVTPSLLPWRDAAIEALSYLGEPVSREYYGTEYDGGVYYSAAGAMYAPGLQALVTASSGTHPCQHDALSAALTAVLSDPSTVGAAERRVLVCGDSVLAGLLTAGMLRLQHDPEAVVKHGRLRSLRWSATPPIRLMLAQDDLDVSGISSETSMVPDQFDLQWHARSPGSETWDIVERFRGYSPLERHELSPAEAEVYSVLRADGLEPGEAAGAARIIH